MQDQTLPKIENLSQKTILGIDYGEKVTGLAIYTLDRDPFPLLHGRIVMAETRDWTEEIVRIISDESVDLVVIGIPLYTDGKESGMTRRVKNQAQSLKDKIGQVPLFFQDETLSSVEAKERMSSSPRFNFKVDMKRIDAVAASIIIELFVNEIKIQS